MPQIITRFRRKSIIRGSASTKQPKSRSRDAILMKSAVATVFSVLALGLSPALASTQSAVELGNEATLLAQGSETPHIVDLIIHVQDHPFKKGPALATANFSFCTASFSCQTVTNSKVITFVR